MGECIGGSVPVIFSSLLGNERLLPRHGSPVFFRASRSLKSSNTPFWSLVGAWMFSLTPRHPDDTVLRSLEYLAEKHIGYIT